MINEENKRSLITSFKSNNDQVFSHDQNDQPRLEEIEDIQHDERFSAQQFDNPTSQCGTSEQASRPERKNRSRIEWTLDQDEILFENYAKQGPKWADLSKLLPNKNQNSIKNRFYCCIRKVQKKINMLQKQRKINHRKLVSLESLLTFIELGKSSLNYDDGRFRNVNDNVNEIIEVKEAIIQQAMRPESELDQAKIESMLHKIVKLKHSLKFINVRRVKKTSKNQNLAVKRKQTTSSTYSPILQEQNLKNDSVVRNDHEAQQSSDLFDLESLQPLQSYSHAHNYNDQLLDCCLNIFEVPGENFDPLLFF